MSTGLGLIPLALAVAGVVGARAQRAERRAINAQGVQLAQAVLTLPTRFRDERVLVSGLARLGAAPQQRDGVWACSVQGIGLALTRRQDGGYDAHFDPRTTVGQAQAVLVDVDRAYCLDLQHQLRGRVYAEAPQRGMTVVDDYREEDGTMVLTLEFGDGS